MSLNAVCEMHANSQPLHVPSLLNCFGQTVYLHVRLSTYTHVSKQTLRISLHRMN